MRINSQFFRPEEVKFICESANASAPNAQSLKLIETTCKMLMFNLSESIKTEVTDTSLGLTPDTRAVLDILIDLNNGTFRQAESERRAKRAASQRAALEQIQSQCPCECCTRRRDITGEPHPHSANS